jgi:hypothetical protein
MVIPYKMNFSLDRLRHVYVSSCRPGFWAVSDNPVVVTNAYGSSANHTMIAIKRVCRENGHWVYVLPDRPGQWWVKKAWDEALALKGAEPWRVYELDAGQVAEQLDSGVFTDDIRGFRNRLEMWQPIIIDQVGDQAAYATPAEAEVWERRDGWRVIRAEDGQWTPEGSRCNAARSTLRFSPHHFDPIPGIAASTAEEAMLVVDEKRPWD